MEIRQLRYFIAVAEEKSFSRAARKVSISQPPITRQIRLLEEDLGTLLLKRTPKGAELTEAGEVFLEDARLMLSTLNRSRERVDAASKGEIGTLNIGYFGSPSYRLVPEIVSAFRDTHPDVDVALHRLSKAEQMRQLKRGLLHIGFGRYYPPATGLMTSEILREDLVLAYSSKLGLGSLPMNADDVLSKNPLVLFPSQGRPNFADDLLAELSKRDIRPNIAVESEDVRAAMIQVATGIGVCIVPKSVSDLNWYGVSFRALPSFEAVCPASYIVKKSDTSPLLRAFRSLVDNFSISRDV